jgi:hypothetical protein
LATIKQCDPEHVSPRTVVWLAVRRGEGRARKRIQVTDLVPVKLVMFTDEEAKLLSDKQLCSKQLARRSFNRARFARWCFEAYEQGGVLTQLDLCFLSGLSHKVVREHIAEYEAETGKIVPTRGTVHDMGPSVTHKAEVIRRWLRHQSPAQIARELEHSQRAVDRYIADFGKVRLLAQRFPVADLPTLSGLSKHLVKQYIDLLREYEPQLTLYQEPQAS